MIMDKKEATRLVLLLIGGWLVVLLLLVVTTAAVVFDGRRGGEFVQEGHDPLVERGVSVEDWGPYLRMVPNLRHRVLAGLQEIYGWLRI